MRVVIAEDQVLLRAGLGRLFEDAGHDVIAAVDDADRLRAAVSEHEPDLAVVDVRMPPSFSDEGIRAASWIRDAHPGVGVLVLSQHVESAGAVALVSAGRLRLSAQGQGPRRGGVPRSGRARCRRRLGPRPEGRGIAGGRRGRQSRRADRARARGALAGGRGPDQPRDRASARAHRSHGRGPRPQRPDEARPAQRATTPTGACSQ